jgi:hypothetical protein
MQTLFRQSVRSLINSELAAAGKQINKSVESVFFLTVAAFRDSVNVYRCTMPFEVLNVCCNLTESSLSE